MRRLFLILIVLVSVFAVAGCAPTKKVINGTITYRERFALPEDAVIQVQLQDVSQMDVAAQVLGEQVFTADGQQVPIPFEVEYDPEQIEENHTCSIQVRITDAQGKLLFITTTAHNVLTRGAPSQDVEVVVEKVG